MVSFYLIIRYLSNKYIIFNISQWFKPLVEILDLILIALLKKTQCQDLSLLLGKNI